MWGLAGLSGGKWASEGWSVIVSRLTLVKINVVNWTDSSLRSGAGNYCSPWHPVSWTGNKAHHLR